MEVGQAERWGPTARPRLAAKVRLQWNAPRGQTLLLFPEGALALNPTARAILELCDGQRTVRDLVRELASRFDGSATADAASGPVPVQRDRGGLGEAPSAEERERLVEGDVRAFFEKLDRRGWLVDEAATGCP